MKEDSTHKILLIILTLVFLFSGIGVVVSTVVMIVHAFQYPSMTTTQIILWAIDSRWALPFFTLFISYLGMAIYHDK